MVSPISRQGPDTVHKQRIQPGIEGASQRRPGYNPPTHPVGEADTP